MKSVISTCAVLVFVLVSATYGSAAEYDLLFPYKNDSLRVRLEIAINGQTPRAVWEAYLDRWFDYLDLDANGTLNATEAAFSFPLPLPTRRMVALRFTELDANSDNEASRTELRDYCKRVGFAPMVVFVQPPNADDLRMSRVIFENLDRDQDGQLSAPEVTNAALLLRRLDEDNDEVLTVAEVLAAPIKQEAFSQPSSVVKAAIANGNSPDAILQLELANKSRSVRLSAIRAEAIQIPVEAKPSETMATSLRVRLSDVFCSFAAGTTDKLKMVQSARGFYLAQLRTALEGKMEIGKDQLEQDVGFQSLVALFDSADHDRNGKLTLAELTAFLDLVEQGVMCQTVISVHCHGRNLFYRMDQNHDGRLDLRELNAAAKLLAPDKLDVVLTESTVPFECDITFERGTFESVFGPVTLGAKAKQSQSIPTPPLTGLRWFDLLDHNQDGALSPREFLGSRQQFERFDRDGDGLISADEARQVNADIDQKK